MTRTAMIAAAIATVGCGIDIQDADWQAAEERGDELPIELQLVPAQPRALGDTLRVATYNVKFGEDTAALIDLFAAPPFDVADVLLLQEMESHQDEGQSRTSAIAGALGMAHVYLPSKKVDGGNHGLATLSRGPLSEVRFMVLPDYGTTLRRDRDVALAVTVGDGDRAIDIVNVHLLVQLSLAERIAQLGPAAHGLPERVILGGDLNTNPYAWLDMAPVVPTEPITDIDVPGAVDDAMREFGYDAPTATSGPTHDTPGEDMRLDSIFTRALSPGAPTVERSVKLSDHYPLWIDVDIAPR